MSERERERERESYLDSMAESSDSARAYGCPTVEYTHGSTAPYSATSTLASSSFFDGDATCTVTRANDAGWRRS